MFNKILLIFFFVCLFAQQPLFKLGNNAYYNYNFFETVPYSEWTLLDTTKKRLTKNSFLEKELVYFESTSLGQQHFGENYIKLKERENQLLINYSYESLVAFPLIQEDVLVAAKKNILQKYFTHHILLGYNGCSLPGSFTATKEEAFILASKIKEEIDSSLNDSPDSLRVSVFQDFAALESQDPSVSKNKGSLGWVSWGRTVASFQEAVFSLGVGFVSDPVLTDFGYHLIFVEKEALSDVGYHNPSFLNDITKKTCLQSLDFEGLRAAAVDFDSSLVSPKKLIINSPVLNNVFLSIEKNTKEKKLRGNKSSYINWIEEGGFSDVLFTYNGQAFGVGWLVYYLNKMPATRVPSIKKEEDLFVLLKSFVLQEAVRGRIQSEETTKKELLNVIKMQIQGEELEGSVSDNTQSDLFTKTPASGKRGMSSQMWLMILILLLLLAILLVVITRGKQTVYLKPKNNNGNNLGFSSANTAPAEFGATQANENDDVKKTELQSLRQKAVSMSVSEKAGANQIVQDWLGDTESEESDDNQETQKEEE